MKDEIKERIKYFKHYVVDNLSLDAQDDFQKILDYITNLQEENEKLNNIINESAEEILKELEENHHLSYGVALAIRQKLLDYKELKGSESNE